MAKNATPSEPQRWIVSEKCGPTSKGFDGKIPKRGRLEGGRANEWAAGAGRVMLAMKLGKMNAR